ncbi:MAG TPA: hypothetical protein VEL74_08450, partial [Thermoanaerobaculia bacterium]|nr:hypothetical protein [Thermoanaerobaculia bacterium]
GIPWQTDEASCLAGYDASAYLPLPSFWAARVPNQVLSHKAFERTTDSGLPAVQRLKHFGYRQFWLRDLQGSGYLQRIDNMVKYWHMVGIVAEQPAPVGTGEEGLPDRYWVETQRDPSFSRSDATWKQLLMVERAEPMSLRTKLAAKSSAALAAELDMEPEEVVHPVRRNVQRDQR